MAGPAGAAPLDEPFVGGMAFTGPTAPNLGAVYWNPAALGLVRGFQLMVAASARPSTVDVSRVPINPMNGLPGPGATMTFPTARASDMNWPSAFGPHTFVALSTDFGGDRFTIGFATYMPYTQKIAFPLSPSNDEPTRYHVLALDLRNLQLAPALAIRFGEFRIGFAPGFLFSTGRLAFAEDLALDGGTAGLASTCPPGTACQVENPGAAARYDISSGNGLGDAKFSVTLGAGLYYRRKSFELGIAYQSHPLGADVPNVEVAGQHTTVTLPPRDMMGGGGPLACPNGQTDRCVFGDISYRLPDVWIAGATWHLGPGVELSAMVRWIWMHTHDRIDVRLSGPTLDADNHDLPQHVVLYRGFKDVWDARARISYWWRERIRLGGMLRFETSAVDANAVTAASVDGFKIEPVVLIEFRLLKQVWLGGGYGITFMRDVDVTDSVFRPDQRTACVDSGNNLTTQACQAQLAGQARPTAAGHYSARAQDFGMTVTFKF